LPQISRHSIQRLAIVLLVALAALLPDASSAEARSYPRLFKASETPGKGLANFPKWRGTLERYFSESKVSEDCSGGFNKCKLKAWQAFLDGLRGQDIMTQINAVHSEMNRRAYIIDPRNWGVPDYWATPKQFLQKNGDCEDYAIAKFMSLRALGVPNENLRIVVLQDLNLKLAHAILVVYVGQKAYVLDNQLSRVVPADSIRHYRPVYSINETGWWLHGLMS